MVFEALTDVSRLVYIQSGIVVLGMYCDAIVDDLATLPRELCWSSDDARLTFVYL